MLDGFKKMNDETKEKIIGGFAFSSIISTILALIPAAFSTIGSAIGLIKSSQASKGEIKVKDFSAKWENDSSNIGYSVGFHYCI
ncbi:hypothetical protein [Metamycoplasma neophronis]|uniref:Uncharacterized protein n=1 Tax=Metamycoplasma neophronis TaxID=872983 RepID=A0ABY2Z0J3_9BACT|nr:hypothetical protein [Metamycoplasma neophronis]TPR53686.1 hypothetical protein FJR74_02165 [Metamycoplasma neophronis]